MNVSAWSIRHPVPALLLFGLLTLLGLRAFGKLGIQNFPDIDFPMVTVQASLEGAAPSQMEAEVARKIENGVATLTGIQHIYTTITEGSASIRVEFTIDKDLNEALDEVRDAVSRVRSDLPADMTDPTISKITTTGEPVVTYAVTSERFDEEALSWFVDDSVSRALLTVPGVGGVTRLGGIDREMRIEIDPVRLNALGVTAAAVSECLRQVHQDPSGGRGDVGGRRQSVRTIAMTGSVERLAELEIPLDDSRRVRLDQIASIQDTAAERESIILFDGKPVVAFQISRTRGSSEVTVLSGVRRAVAELTKQHPQVQVAEAYDSVGPVLDSYRGSMELLYEGAVLAMVVVFCFLLNARATIISATALPLSIIPTFLLMAWLGFSLNVISLLALALVVGVLVDDAIVEIENIDRHLRLGKTPYQAAMEAADEIGLAVIATTFTLVAVFLPTAFMDGIPGKIFRQFGWTAGIAVLFSLLVARLVTPMLAAYLLKPGRHERRDGLVMRGYLAAAGWCLRHRWSTLFAAGLFFAGSMALVPLMSTTFFPPSDRNRTAIGIELTPGSTLEQTGAAVARVQAMIKDIPEIVHVVTCVGSGGDVRKASMTLILSPRADRVRTQAQVEADLRSRLPGLPGARLSVGGMHSGETLTLVLAGNDSIALMQAVQAAQRDLRTIPGLGNITSDASLLRPEVQITPDPARAADLGVTTGSIMSAVQVATAGDFAPRLARLNLPGRQLKVRVRMKDALRSDLDAFGRLRIPGNGGTVLLGSVASIGIGSGPAEINRLDRVRRVELTVELNGQQLGDVYKKAVALPALVNLSPGVSRNASGEAEHMTELFGSFGMAMFIGVMCIYIVLVLLFHDFLQPLTILAALPLATGGALLALLVCGFPFSMPSVIGLLMLMGIVTKNSILLIDYAIMARREHGLGRHEALIDACHKRATPIVMTTVAMAVGMLPIALGWGAEPSFRAPMATAVIGGLLTSTMLSLLVIPVVFTIVDDVVGLLRRAARRIGHHSG